MQKKAPATRPPVPTEVDFAAYRVADPEEFSRNMLRLMEEGGKVMAGFLERTDGKISPLSAASDMTDATKLFGEIAQSWLKDPAKLAATNGALVRDLMLLAAATSQRMLGTADVAPVAEPEPGDNRFKDPEWERNPYFDFWKQAYLIATRWLDEVLEKTDGLDERTRQQAAFYIKQLTSALSPSNFPFTNPEVLRETLASSGQNLVQGMANLVHDMEGSGEIVSISQTDVAAFEVGRNVATAPGKVVFQNDLLQLIQYTPSTETVHERPLLIVPPWINKFYILDLTAPKSYIRYMVGKGFTVFVVSWVNPDERLAHKTFEDYMTEGLLAATNAVKRETGTDKVNVIGYCVGGTLLGTTLAYLAARGEEPFASATFFAAQVDFTKAGDLMLFIDDSQLKALEEMMAERGYLDGSRMATVFNLLRPKDLIWPYIVNNYMLGKKPFPFDLLYWNQELDADDARQPQLLPARVLSREQAGPRADDDRRRQARPHQGQAADLRAVRQGGPHRAGEVGVHRLAPVRRPGHLRAGGIRPHRRRHQPAGREGEVPVLDQRQEGGDAGSVDGKRQGASGLLVAALRGVADAIRGQHGAGAQARRHARRHRGRAGELCEDEELIFPTLRRYAEGPLPGRNHNQCAQDAR